MTEHHRTPEWRRITRIMRPLIRAQLPLPCVNRCVLGGVVEPGQPFDVAHVVDVDHGGDDSMDNLGPAHVRCNRSDGGKAGAMKQKAQRQTKARFPNW